MPLLPVDLRFALRSEGQRSFWLSFPAFLLVGVAGLAVMAFGPTIWWWELGMALALFEAPVALWLLRLRLTWWRLRPARDLVTWAAAEEARQAAEEWQSIDSGKPPTSPVEALSRLGERTGDLAKALRLRALMEIRRWDLCRAELDSWHPDAPISRAQRQLFLLALASSHEPIDEYATQTAIDEIADEGDRHRAVAEFGLWKASRAALGRHDPIGPMAETRRQLGTVIEPSGAGALEALAVVLWMCLGCYFLLNAIISIVSGRPI
jgi:hypothetical protein